MGSGEGQMIFICVLKNMLMRLKQVPVFCFSNSVLFHDVRTSEIKHEIKLSLYGRSKKEFKVG